MARLIEPRLHDSKGSRGCSPQGLVLSISPICGVGLSLLILSRKMIPGSPFRQAMFTIMSNTLRAFILDAGSLVLGLTSSYSPSSARAAMNLSVSATEMLKLVSLVLSFLLVMN